MADIKGTLGLELSCHPQAWLRYSDANHLPDHLIFTSIILTIIRIFLHQDPSLLIPSIIDRPMIACKHTLETTFIYYIYNYEYSNTNAHL